MSFGHFQNCVVLRKVEEITQNTSKYKVSLNSGELMDIQMEDGLVAGDEVLLEETTIFVCGECENELMYNSKTKEYYCPKCDE